MSYSIKWYIEDEIIYIRYSGTPTYDEFREAILEANELIEGSSRSLVHTVSDLGDVTRTPSPKDSLKLAREVGVHERVGWTIFIRETAGLTKMIVAMFTSLTKVRTRSFNTMDEAIDFLKSMDTDLNWEKVEKNHF